MKYIVVLRIACVLLLSSCTPSPSQAKESRPWAVYDLDDNMIADFEQFTSCVDYAHDKNTTRHMWMCLPKKEQTK